MLAAAWYGSCFAHMRNLGSRRATILLDATLASKLATIVVNAQDYAESGYDGYWEAVCALLDDATVQEWVASLGPLAPLPKDGARR